MSSTGTNAYCLPCQQLTHWIEILVRDENNQPFSGVTGVVVDSNQVEHPVELSDAPILIEQLPPGPVQLVLDAEPWILEAQAETHPRNNTDKPTKDFADGYSGHNGGLVKYAEITTGDLTLLPEKVTLPPYHQKGQGDAVKLVVDKTYVLQVRAYKFITLRVGMFFDGTANNTYGAKWGKQELEKYYSTWKAKYEADCDILSRKTGYPKNAIPEVLLSDDCFAYPKKDNFFISLFKNDDGEIETVEGSATNELTNVQKLSDLYIRSDGSIIEGLFTDSIYVTGIGTGNSTNIAPADESVIWGQGAGIGEYGVVEKVNTGIDQFVLLLKDLTYRFKSDQQNTTDGIKKIQFDVFGFSRGAAAARHFINILSDGKSGNLAKAVDNEMSKGGVNLPYCFDWNETYEDKASCEVSFAGLFDTVASVVDLLSFDFSTHTDNGDVRLWLDPKRVRNVVHLTADPTVECRDNFSLNRLNSTDQSHFYEFVLPGAHSDIGGGYHSRLSYLDKKDYLLPILERKLVKRVTRSFSDSRSRKKAVNYVESKLEFYKKRDVLTGWNEADYIDPPLIKVINTKNDGGHVTGSLFIQRKVEGDLSRLYLRLMYGLAEFHGVPLDDNEGKIWEDPDPYAAYYIVDELKTPSLDFKKLNQRVLDLAKQGEYVTLEETLTDVNLKKELMKLNLFHHSSGDDIGMAPLWDEAGNCYKRASYDCVEGE
ncbi:DUF2235 domain-containing protein [Vibrio fluvialis]|uniref:T6SS phospholipase effector Tle1-like catalytic domain-containing protein n=1 Tax=Vibrio fluvialis TaxID=676 RepID=UPI001559C896|nr:DUF2235 domain-containing protein [Vibrio fluvialis]ELO1773956.1 DUF2235 domain-containing protein [Vibrio fluvialis]ELO1776658.1 DUF2235 domain-containing protein [Vibrio fluvialis]MBY7830541.1 DUF2235 domain-containing protein [Vibrio fluvialis]MBY7868761.1 DUF2235 domain-containing protein [Vibrio fluvialis]MBY7906525.1 DUF2235 domain-containing protein [Vibrio fluvialis]